MKRTFLILITTLFFFENNAQTTADSLKPVVTKIGCPSRIYIAKSPPIIDNGLFQQKQNNTVSYSRSVRNKNFNQGRLTDPIELIQGGVAGLAITKNGGDPNRTFDVNIRGINSFLNDQTPLYVIDGIVGADPTLLAPDDITSFTVLKDVASTSIYGVLGVNGVIVISTKQNVSRSTKKLSVDYRTFLSIDRVSNQYDVLNADQIRTYANENNINMVDGGASTNWMDELYRTTLSQNHYIRVNSQLKNTTLSASYNYNTLNGTLQNSNRQRHNLSLAANQLLLDGKLRLNGNIRGMLESAQRIDYSTNDYRNPIYQALQHHPTDPVKNSDGSYYQPNRYFQSANLLAIVDGQVNEQARNQLTADISAAYQIAPSLRVTAMGVAGTHTTTNWYAEPKGFYNGLSQGFASLRQSNGSFNYLKEALEYNPTLKGNHSLSFNLGHSFYIRKDSSSFNSTLSSNLGTNGEVRTATLDTFSFSSQQVFRELQEKIHSGFTQINYNYASRYFLRVNTRLDNVTQEFTESRNHLSWGIRGSWQLSNENFWQKNTILTDAILSISQGRTANRIFPIVDPNSINLLAERTPETIDETSVGINLSWRNGRIQTNVSLYRRVANNLLLNFVRPISPFPPFGPAEFFGKIENRGVELELDAILIQKAKLRWTSSFNVTRNQQEILDLDDQVTFIRQNYITGRGLVGGNNYSQLLEKGETTGSFYLPQYAGRSDDGYVLYKAQNGGVTRNQNQAQRAYVGSSLPDMIIGWSHSLTLLGHFDARLSIRGIFGHDIFNADRLLHENPDNLPLFNALASALEEENINVRSTAFSDYYLEKGDFMRLENISIGYTLANIQKIENLRISLSSNNLYTWTTFRGLDPEQFFNNSRAGIQQNAYAPYRNFALGIEVIL